LKSDQEFTYKLVSLPRWQRKWLREHKSINCSGFLQEKLDILIAARDPEYYAKYKIKNEIKRKETTLNI
jgi:hypothetical protein